MICTSCNNNKALRHKDKCLQCLAESSSTPKAKKHIESEIQQSCVAWFRLQLPNIFLFSINNGGKMSPMMGGILKRMGTVAGVSDLFMAYPNKQFHGLFIEMKTEKGTQSESQKEFERGVLKSGYQYIVVRSLDQFKNEIKLYLYE